MPNRITIFQFMELIRTNAQAIRFFQRLRWHKGLLCMNCGVIDSATIHGQTKSGFSKYRCVCGHVFSDISDTCLKKTRIGLRFWLYALFELSQNKSISSCELEEKCGIPQKTAWYLLIRLRRECTRLMQPFEKLMMRGVTESDEAYLGKSKNSQLVQGLLQRGKHAVIKQIADRTEVTLKGNIAQHIRKKSYIMTDTAAAYGGLCCHDYRHFTVNHSLEEFSKGHGIHANTIEGLWGNLKKVLYGVHHGVSKNHLSKYTAEFLTKYNYRHAQNRFCLLLNLFFSPPLTC